MRTLCLALLLAAITGAGGCSGCGHNSADQPDAGECSAASECDALHGPAPCGAWECNAGKCEVNCPGCTDADKDGYGVDTTPGACAGPDCDDANDTVFDTAARSCYSGPAGTAGVGTCRSGAQACTAGVWTPCQGEVVPSGEACNLEDDDCNGTPDDGLAMISCGLGACATTASSCVAGATGTCTPTAPLAANDTTCDGVDDDCDGAVDEDCATCVKVAPTGNDATAVATNNATPFLTVQAAVTWAAGTAGRPHVVCVASGAACGATATYNGPLVMADGINVGGGYESTTFTQCPTSKTILAPGVPEGVMFPATVTTATALDNFQVDRATATTTSAITVDGAHNAIIAGVQVINTPTVTSSYGVNVINGGTATITRSSLTAGTGTSESIAIRSVGSTVTAIANCQTIDATTHRCTNACGTPGVRAKFAAGTGESYGVLLDNSPGSQILQTGICGGFGDQAAGVRVRGNGAGIVIRGSMINTFQGTSNSHGVWLEDCGGAAPWIVNNERINATGAMNTPAADGVHAVGDCHPVVDSNALISGGGEGNALTVNGVYCGTNASGASRCVVLGNTRIQGSLAGFPPSAAGVRCDDGACNRIARNTIDGRGGLSSWGVRMMRTGALVERNVITGGCSTVSATGLYAEDAWSRIENNAISGGTCGPGAAMMPTSRGLHVVAGPMPGELDVHSNTIDGLGMPLACTSVGLELDALAGVTGPDGAYANNILTAGACATRYDLREAAAAADPRILHNTDFAPNNNPTALYLDENASAVTSAAAIDALADISAAGTQSADPMFISYPGNLHIASGSVCNGAGTAAGAPAIDFDGDARDTVAPDIGFDEVP